MAYLVFPTLNPSHFYFKNMGCNSAKNTSAVEPSHSVSPTKKTNAEKHQTAALAALDEVIE